MVELRRTGFNARPGRTFIVHLDEETVITEPHLLLLADYLSRDPRPISQGPILYPLEWEQTPWICRAIESTRPFGCSECARVMKHPPPPHLHGSNLVIDESIENQVEWDFGTLDGQPFIAEDLLFGLRAFSMLGKEAFGWHGATAIEQPPLSLYWAVQQRLRWVTGALQGLRAMRVKPEFATMGRTRKLKLSLSVYSRIATYSLGFPVGLTGLVFLFHPIPENPSLSSPLFGLRLFLLLSALAWIVSYQIGMHRNLRYQEMPGWRRAQHHLVMLVLTPIVGLCETAGPYVALVRWLVGARTVQWTPTPKLSDRPAQPESVPAPGVTAIPLPVAGMPAWLRPVAGALAVRVRRPPRSPLVTTGRALIGAGVAITLFLGYEFGGTNLAYDRSQQSLLVDFKQHVSLAAGRTKVDGTAVALLSIPRLGSTQVRGPGHQPSGP
jgi:beta-1,4-mannosyltransferase